MSNVRPVSSRSSYSDVHSWRCVVISGRLITDNIWISLIMPNWWSIFEQCFKNIILYYFFNSPLKPILSYICSDESNIIHVFSSQIIKVKDRYVDGGVWGPGNTHSLLFVSLYWSVSVSLSASRRLCSVCRRHLHVYFLKVQMLSLSVSFMLMDSKTLDFCTFLHLY